MKKTVYLYPEIKIPVIINVEENDNSRDLLHKSISAFYDQKPDLNNCVLLINNLNTTDIEDEYGNPINSW